MKAGNLSSVLLLDSGIGAWRKGGKEDGSYSDDVGSFAGSQYEENKKSINEVSQKHGQLGRWDMKRFLKK